MLVLNVCDQACKINLVSTKITDFVVLTLSTIQTQQECLLYIMQNLIDFLCSMQKWPWNTAITNKDIRNNVANSVVIVLACMVDLYWHLYIIMINN